MWPNKCHIRPVDWRPTSGPNETVPCESHNLHSGIRTVYILANWSQMHRWYGFFVDVQSYRLVVENVACIGRTEMDDRPNVWPCAVWTDTACERWPYNIRTQTRHHRACGQRELLVFRRWQTEDHISYNRTMARCRGTACSVDRLCSGPDGLGTVCIWSEFLAVDPSPSEHCEEHFVDKKKCVLEYTVTYSFCTSLGLIFLFNLRGIFGSVWCGVLMVVNLLEETIANSHASKEKQGNKQVLVAREICHFTSVAIQTKRSKTGRFYCKLS